MKKILENLKSDYARVVVLCFFAMGFIARCANPATPQGGPKDSLPPVILSMTPAMYTTNFSEKEVVILFDEYVKLTNSQTEVLVSPYMERKPSFTVKGKSLYIRFEDGLDSATTYKIDFGLSLSDNNEGNVLTNFSYIFSTGDEIDSLAMSGQVIDAFTGDSVFNALIMLYDAKADSLVSDSVLALSSPLSIARTDSMGVFIATNLKDTEYKIYAISEKTSNGIYERGTDYVAFSDTTYNPALLPPFKVWYNPYRSRIEATPQMQFRLFFEEAVARRQSLDKVNRSSKHKLYLEFAAKSPEITSFVIDSVNMDSIIIERSMYSDTMTIFIPTYNGAILPDSLKGYIEYASMTADSVPKDTLIVKDFALGFRELRQKKLKEGEVEENPFKIDAKIPKQLNPYSDIILEFAEPLQYVDTSNIQLVKSVTVVQEGERGDRNAAAKAEQSIDVSDADFTLEPDTLSKLKWVLRSEWEPGAKYELIFRDSTFADIISQSNDSTYFKFDIMDPEKFSTININLMGRDSTANYIVMLLSRKAVKYQVAEVISDDIVFEYVTAGEYQIRVVKDVNGNGKWDDGKLHERVMPEPTLQYKDDSGFATFEAKENWELNMNIDISELSK